LAGENSSEAKAARKALISRLNAEVTQSGSPEVKKYMQALTAADAELAKATPKAKPGIISTIGALAGKLTDGLAKFINEVTPDSGEEAPAPTAQPATPTRGVGIPASPPAQGTDEQPRPLVPLRFGQPTPPAGRESGRGIPSAALQYPIRGLQQSIPASMAPAENGSTSEPTLTRYIDELKAAGPAAILKAKDALDRAPDRFNPVQRTAIETVAKSVQKAATVQAESPSLPSPGPQTPRGVHLLQ
jgi:hypothetical protein